MGRKLWPVLFICAIGFAFPVSGQEANSADATDQDATTDTSADQPDTNSDDPTDIAPEESTAVEKTDPGPAALAFDASLTNWKKLLKEIRDIRAEYAIAEDDKLAGLQADYIAKIGQGREMESELQATAIAAYQESPNDDRELVRFLITMAADFIRADNYQTAQEIMELLIDNGSNEKELNDLAGIAAFGTNDFDAAATLLKAADDSGTISTNGSKFLSQLDECQTTWQQEAELRESEASQDDLPRVKLQTDVGDIVLELYENEAPETVGNFISLVEKGFYNGLTFHRVLGAFMAQGGCPDGTGGGGPGYNIYCECVNDGHRKHFAGSLSMAKQLARNTGGSQFFITFVPTPSLNGQHTVFGRVIEGWDVLPKIVKRDPDGAPPFPDPTTIVKAEVLRKRDHEYRPNKVK